MSRTRAFSYQNRKLQVTASAEADGWAVRLFFEDGSRASPLAYKIVHEGKVGDAMKGHPGDLVEQLMVVMRSNVESGQIRLIPKSN
jgi:hypothetical protein